MALPLRLSPPDFGGRDPRWVVLYAVTLAVQGVCGFARGVALIIPLGIVFAIAGIEPVSAQVGNDPVSDLCLVIAFGPLVFSVLSLIRPVGAGSYWRTRIGGRAPSGREREIFDEVLELLRERDPGMRVPRWWFLVDDLHTSNGAVLGDTLMLTTGALLDTALEPVLAHELGHLNTIDARLTVALNRLALPANLFARLYRAEGDGGCLVTLIILAAWVCSGELAFVFLRPLWDAWFRARDRPIPFRFISGASHPSTEHRIQALRNLDHQQAALQ
jgi:hypothetical protein